MVTSVAEDTSITVAIARRACACVCSRVRVSLCVCVLCVFTHNTYEFIRTHMNAQTYRVYDAYTHRYIYTHTHTHTGMTPRLVMT